MILMKTWKVVVGKMYKKKPLHFRGEAFNLFYEKTKLFVCICASVFPVARF